MDNPNTRKEIDMHVTSSRSDRRHRGKRPSIAAVLMIAIAGFAGVANAVEFDQKLNAPMMKSAADFQTQAQSFGTRYREIRAATPAQMISNAALARQQFDLNWQLEHAVNEGRPLDGLETIGLVSKGDGSYSVDLGKHPEWRIESDRFVSVLNSSFLDGICALLLQRGFRPEDVEILKGYIAGHDANAAARAANLSASLAFRRVVQKFDKAGRPVPNALVISLWYQNTRNVNEANRAWTVGLLKALDAQRVRVLLSYFMEMESTMDLIPEDVSTAINQTLTNIRLPDFEQRATAAVEGVSP